MNVKMIVIDHKDQRYPTVGDWVFNRDGDLVITVSTMDDWKKEICVMLHELIEACLCKERGIKEEDVSKFDIQFEEARAALGYDAGEPGNQTNAPYHKEHMFATSVEMQFAGQLNLDWNDYEEVVNSL